MYDTIEPIPDESAADPLKEVEQLCIRHKRIHVAAARIHRSRAYALWKSSYILQSVL